MLYVRDWGTHAAGELEKSAGTYTVCYCCTCDAVILKKLSYARPAINQYSHAVVSHMAKKVKTACHKKTSNWMWVIYM